MPPEILDIALNCTSLAKMTQFDRVSEVSTQTPHMIVFLTIWILFGLFLFIYGVTTQLGKSRKMLLTNEHYFAVIIGWFVALALTLLFWWKPYYLLMFA